MLSSKNFTIIAGTLIIFLLALLLCVRIIVLDSFIHIEEKEAQEHIERVASGLDNKIAIVDRTCSDYATWDDIYLFLNNRNSDFIRLNFADESLKKLRIDFLSIILLDGKEIFSKSVEPKKGVFSPYRDLKPYLFDGVALINRDGGAQGLILSGDTALIVSSKPILTSEGKGPVAGMLIMGRLIDAEELQHLSDLVKLPLTITPFKQAAASKSATPVISIKRPDFNTLSASHLFYDLNMKPAFTISAKIDREIYREGDRTVKNFSYALFAGTLLAIFVISRLTSRISTAEWNSQIAETLYDSVIEESSVAALIMDAETCRIIKITPDMAKLLGYSPEKLNGVLFRELLYESLEQFEQCRSAAFAQGREPVSARLNLMRSDCSVIPVLATATLKTRAGKGLLVLHYHNT